MVSGYSCHQRDFRLYGDSYHLMIFCRTGMSFGDFVSNIPHAIQKSRLTFKLTQCPMTLVIGTTRAMRCVVDYNLIWLLIAIWMILWNKHKIPKSWKPDLCPNSDTVLFEILDQWALPLCCYRLPSQITQIQSLLSCTSHPYQIWDMWPG